MQLEVGTIVEGKVTGFTSFGAFIDLGEGKKGLVHISEVANEYVKEIGDHLTVGQEVKVKILSIGDDGKISLSIKKAVEEKKPQPKPRQSYSRPANVWQGNKSSDNGARSFEDMMAKFKQVSDEKMSDLKRDSKHGGGFNRRGTNKI
ncbi:MAG: S1 RNA-binding domain-containing protein [Clostridia bacterium]|nr:S1 RNA-binding domain-containing protein [Clostridia bacterium]